MLFKPVRDRSCPSREREESAQFTLTSNSIVNVATNLPVESSYDDAQHIYTYDSLALSVLDATTPIPGEFSGDPNGYCTRPSRRPGIAANMLVGHG